MPFLAKKYLLRFSFLLVFGFVLWYWPSQTVFASWVYDALPPTITLSITCGDGNVPTPNGSGGTCSSNTAQVTVACTDNAGGSGCKAVYFTVNGVACNNTGGCGNATSQIINLSAGSTSTFVINTGVQAGFGYTCYQGSGTGAYMTCDNAGNKGWSPDTPYTLTLSSCTAAFSPTTITVQDGGTTTGTVNVTTNPGSPNPISRVDFSSSQGSVASVTTPDITGTGSGPYSYTADITGSRPGSTIVSASVVVGSTPLCTAQATAEVVSTQAWWQAKDADITAAGDIVSHIPSGTYNLIDDGAGGYPGIPIYTGSLDTSAGSLSAKNWKARTSYTGKTYDFAYFKGTAPAEVITDPRFAVATSEINASQLVDSAKLRSDGFVWHYRSGDLTINGANNFGSSRIVLIVEGNLSILNNLTLDDGAGSFVVIASGNITLDRNVSHPNNPALEGLFFTGRQFITGSGNGRLYVRGSVAALGGILLQRDLGQQNRDTAAEYFEYDPSLLFNFPRELMKKGIEWREIAP